jgi:hypothetical protein
MLIPKTFRLLNLATFSVCCLLFLTSPARAQFKIELQTCEDLKIAKAQYGVNVVETATWLKADTSKAKARRCGPFDNGLQKFSAGE